MGGSKRELLMALFSVGDSGKYDQSYLDKYADGNNESVSWNEVLDPSKASSGAEYQVKYLNTICIYDGYMVVICLVAYCSIIS